MNEKHANEREIDNTVKDHLITNHININSK